MLTIADSRVRQQGLFDVMKKENLDAIVVADPRHVYYFSTFLTGWLHYSALAMLRDGRTFLVTANKPAENVAADDVFAYEAQWNATLRQEQPADVARAMISKLKPAGVRKVGLDASFASTQVALQWQGMVFGIDEHLWQMRRRKHADELALMRKAIRCTEAMYRRAREIVRPGVEEIEVFAELQKAAILEAGEPLSALLGNDFQCGSGGGPPRAGRKAQAGELYVLDLGPAYKGYFADNCRTFSVDGSISDQQRRAYDAIAGVFPLIEAHAKPGVRCQDLYTEAHEHLRKAYGTGMKHHLGHGVGLQPHEYPHLNPKWDDRLLEGEVFTVEPGLYGPELRGGIRIEQNYLVTKDGVESLLNFPLEMG
jgi:Xaa-Pro dipeptidase